MKITSVELHPENSSNIAVLSFKDPRRQSSYNVKSITGLDADNIVPKYYGNSITSNSAFYNLSLQKREIVAKIGLNPKFENGETFSSLRDNLYKMIFSSRTGLVQVQFKNGLLVVAVASGWITKFEYPHFERVQEVQITINMVDPFLKDPNLFDYPVQGLNSESFNIQDLDSSVPHGFNVVLVCKAYIAPSASVIIKNVNDDSWKFEVYNSTGIFDWTHRTMIHICTDPFNKEIYAHYFDGNDEYTVPMGELIAAGSVWPVIFPGDNVFNIEPHASLDLISLSYYKLFWGI